MTKIMLLGDIHGSDAFFRRHVIPAAIKEGVRWIYQVGDFGYWEHTDEGTEFLNEISDALIGTGIELVFIPGNHDKVSMIPSRYNMLEGFYTIRPALWYAPNGTHWTVDGKGFLVLGGAYSVDKDYRLKAEAAKAQKIIASRQGSNYDYGIDYVTAQAHAEAAETLWFPEEEMTDSELDKILASVKAEDVDVILAHDKPLASNPMVKLMPIAECIPNQRRLQKAINALQPELFVHGHLHARYTDTIRCGDNDAHTRVEGLGADVPNFNQLVNSWEPSDAWEILNL